MRNRCMSDVVKGICICKRHQKHVMLRLPISELEDANDYLRSISWFVNSSGWRIVLKENLALQARVRQKLPALGVLCPCAESRVTWICSRTMGIHLLFDQGRTRDRRVATRGGYFVSLLWLQMSGLAVAQKDDMPESAGPGAPETEMNELAQESVADAGNCSMDVEANRMSLDRYQELFCHCVGINMLGGRVSP